jgi:polysaccharide biosynthesis/export protein
MRLWFIILLSCLPGCLSLGGSPHNTEPALLPVPPHIPRELQKTTLPDYVIEPPDILRIEVTRLVPKAPYKLGPGDGLLVQVAQADGTLILNEVISVELDGTMQFGSPFDDPNEETDPALHIDGPINVGGLYMDEARKLVTAHVAKTVASPSVRVTLSEFAMQQTISGEHLVASDGTVTLGAYGRVRVTGLTVEEAREAVNSHLSQFLQLPNASVDVFAYNSKNYYIILQGAGLGDQVAQFPVTGNETVLDALSNVNGLSSTSSDEVWISRPGRNIFEGHQILPVNYCAVTQFADTTTNYQLMPGDRLFVREDKLMAADTQFGKIIAPIERILGVVLLGTNTASRIEFYKQQGQRGFGTGGGGGTFP